MSSSRQRSCCVAMETARLRLPKIWAGVNWPMTRLSSVPTQILGVWFILFQKNPWIVKDRTVVTAWTFDTMIQIYNLWIMPLSNVSAGKIASPNLSPCGGHVLLLTLGLIRANIETLWAEDRLCSKSTFTLLLNWAADSDCIWIRIIPSLLVSCSDFFAH